MIRTKLSIAIAVALGSGIAFDSWKAGLVIGTTTMVWRIGGAVTKSVFILDHETGEMTAQSADEASARYLRAKDKR